jgi:hypothetical protein
MRKTRALARGWYAVLPFGTAPVPTETCCPADCDVECCTSGRGSSATPEESCAVVLYVNVQCMLTHASPAPPTIVLALAVSRRAS